MLMAPWSAAPDELFELKLLLATAPNVELSAGGAVEKPDFVLLGDEAAAVCTVDVVVAAPVVVATVVTSARRRPWRDQPQGMAELSSWEVLAGSVVLPSAPTMVKRVVQVRAETFAGEEN